MSTGRPANILRPTKLTTTLPEDVRAKLDLYLFSAVEGRVPVGAYSRFLAERVREFFDSKLKGKEERIRAMEDFVAKVAEDSACEHHERAMAIQAGNF